MSVCQESCSSTLSYQTAQGAPDHDPPGAMNPTIDPPARRSSLGFSQLLSKPQQLVEGPAQDEDDLQIASGSPSRGPCNVGRKRLVPTTPLVEPAATSRQVTQLQRIFSNAQASLQLDMRFASSPGGSIDSRLPTDDTIPEAENLCPRLREVERRSRVKQVDWRYSTVPFFFSSTDLDVREPFPEQVPLLHIEDLDETNQTKVFVVKSGTDPPMSAGGCHQDISHVHSAFAPQSHWHQRAGSHGAEDRDQFGKDKVRLDFPIPTELERPITGLQFQNMQGIYDPRKDGQESPTATGLKSQFGHQITDDRFSVSPPSPKGEIFLSTPAKVAAEVAKEKRCLLRRGSRRASNKENIEPKADQDDLSEITEMSIVPDPDPDIQPRTHSCPYPTFSFYNNVNVPTSLSVKDIRRPHSPNICGENPGRSPLRERFPQPPSYSFSRTTACGELVLPQIKSPTYSTGGPSPQPQEPRAFGDSSSRPFSSKWAPTHVPISRPTASDHFQPGWYYSGRSVVGQEESSSLRYAFSTAAAKAAGSSPAPDSRIRDSYRTDTLTPLARPAIRFRKNGIASLTNHGVSKYYNTSRRPGESRQGSKPKDRVSKGKRRCTTITPSFMSSPPRPVAGNVGSDFQPRPPQSRYRRRTEGQIEFLSGGQTGGPHPDGDEQEFMMEVEEEDWDLVRMSMISKSRTPDNRNEGIAELSPNVSLWRKGTQPKKTRTSSYWDGDLAEVRNSPAGRRVDQGLARLGDVMNSPKREIDDANVMDRNMVWREQVPFEANDLYGEFESATGEFEKRVSSGNRKRGNLDVQLPSIIRDTSGLMELDE